MRFFSMLTIMAMSLLVLVTTPLQAAQDHYQIGSGDTISIQVYGEEDLSLDSILVSSDGYLDYPYLGRIRVINKTAEQLKNELTRGLAGDYLVNPKIMVSVTRYRLFYVNGEVRQPGGFEFRPGLTVEKAIALAGGLTDRASRREINLTRHKNGQTLTNVSMTQSVNPGDIIFVDESFF